MQRCNEITRLLSESMDQKLPWRTRLQIRLHNLFCIWCRRYGDQIRLLRQAIRKFPDEAPLMKNGKMPDSSKERIRQLLRSPGK